MARIQITGEHLHLNVEYEPSADFVTCLIPALLAALPAFIEAFMTCLSGSQDPGDYKPGDRPRCT